MVAECCKAKPPVLPLRVPVTTSMATYPAAPCLGSPPENISPLLVASKSPWICLLMENRASPSAGGGVRGRTSTVNVPVALMVLDHISLGGYRAVTPNNGREPADTPY